MIKLSLILNVLVLAPVCLGIYQNSEWAIESYGGSSPARSILLSVYLTILVTSVTLLFIKSPEYVVALLVVQVVYKSLSPFTVGAFDHPVVVSNLLITAVHVVTLVLIFSSGVLSDRS